MVLAGVGVGLVAGVGDVGGAVVAGEGNVGLVAGVGDATGAGVAEDEQATATNRATMIIVPSRESDERI